MTRQVCIIHGGTVFESHQQYLESLHAYTPDYDRLLYATSWKVWLAEQLSDWDVLLPSMPSKLNAQYDEWAIYFSKVLPYLRSDATLIGHSLGGIFLAKYLSDHPPASPYARLMLVAAPYQDETNESLREFKLSDVSNLTRAARSIHLFASKDDPVVPFDEIQHYRRDLPDAVVHEFDDKGHFNEPTFPELLALIKS